MTREPSGEGLGRTVGGGAPGGGDAECPAGSGQHGDRRMGQVTWLGQATPVRAGRLSVPRTWATVTGAQWGSDAGLHVASSTPSPPPPRRPLAVLAAVPHCLANPLTPRG